MKKIFSYIANRPQLSILYGFLGILGLLLMLLTVNGKNWRLLKGKTSWIASSNYSKTRVDWAIDRNMETQWSSHAPMGFGMFFQVDIATPSVINGLVLHVGKDKRGQPDEWVVKTSLDGENWQAIIPRRHINYRSMLAILFAPVRARHIQIVLNSGGAPSAWQIRELDLLQPLVPWQFERSILTFWILGWIFTMVSVLLCIPGQVPSRERLILPIVMILIVLSGWVLRVYDISSYEFSDREWEYFSFLDFGRYTHIEWIKGFFQNVKAGRSWLALLFSRWAYQFFSNYLVSMRIVPAIFGVCTVFLVFLIWKIFLSGRQISSYHRQGVLWEQVLASALVSVAGFPVLLSRRSDVSVSLIVFILLYLVLTYQFVYRKGTYGWVPVLILLLFTGFSVDPAMDYVPVGIILFGGVNLLFQGFCAGWGCLKNQALRLIIYGISALPLYLYQLLFLREHWTQNASFSFASFSPFFHELSGSLQFCGFSGIGVWIFGGGVLIGIAQLLYYRDHGEWFLYIQGILFSILVVLFSPPEHISSQFLLITLLVIFLLVKGIYAILIFLFFRSRSRKSGKQPPSDRIKKQYSIARIAALIIVTSYFALFSINSLFLGNSAYPYASGLYEEYKQKKRIRKLIEIIKADPNECKTVGVLDQGLDNFYSAMYKIHSSFVDLPGLKRFSDFRRFWTYLLVPISLENSDMETITGFLNQHYTEIGKSAQVSLYKLRDEFRGQQEHYSPKYLFSNTGRRIEDKFSINRWVKSARKGDPPGILASTPAYRTCQPGRYTARFAIRATGDTDEVVAILEIFVSRYDVLRRLELKGSDFVDSTAYQIFDLPFDLDMTDNPAFQMKRLQFLVQFTGESEVRVDYVELIPEE